MVPRWRFWTHAPPKGTGLAYDSITNHNQPMQETNGEDLGGGEVVDSNPYGVINECATIANNYPPPPPAVRRLVVTFMSWSILFVQYSPNTDRETLTLPRSGTYSSFPSKNTHSISS